MPWKALFSTSNLLIRAFLLSVCTVLSLPIRAQQPDQQTTPTFMLFPQTGTYRFFTPGETRGIEIIDIDTNRERVMVEVKPMYWSGGTALISGFILFNSGEVIISGRNSAKKGLWLKYPLPETVEVIQASVYQGAPNLKGLITSKEYLEFMNHVIDEKKIRPFTIRRDDIPIREDVEMDASKLRELLRGESKPGEQIGASSHDSTIERVKTARSVVPNLIEDNLTSVSQINSVLNENSNISGQMETEGQQNPFGRTAICILLLSMCVVLSLIVIFRR